MFLFSYRNFRRLQKPFFYNPSEIINVTVNQITINSIIENEIQNLDKIDIVSLDIEGGELNCLYGFDLEKYKPKVLIYL